MNRPSQTAMKLSWFQSKESSRYSILRFLMLQEVKKAAVIEPTINLS